MTSDKLSVLGDISKSHLNRRALLSGGVGVAAISMLAACSPGGSTPASGSKTTTLGSGSSDDVPKRAYAAVVTAFQKKSGDTVKVNTVAHNDFQNNINTYLQGSPDDSFTWFAGYRMRYYAGKGLAAPIDDVWEKIGGNFSEGLTKASTADDGKKYFVPNYNYPWGFSYRKSVWEAKGYTVPAKFDDLITLTKKMQGD
ncbi:MAG: carbohydrate ABC transporter substrate-binding protein, partial [Microbacteriaceae bacterium]|nr:carbohydrate ABC transporter substrate-binding protein [Microbacteriaceae bacterium]